MKYIIRNFIVSLLCRMFPAYNDKVNKRVLAKMRKAKQVPGYVTAFRTSYEAMQRNNFGMEDE